MDRKRVGEFLKRVRAIEDLLGEMDRALDTEELQVGDFQALDRSLRVITRETESLATHLEGMLADETRTTG